MNKHDKVLSDLLRSWQHFWIEQDRQAGHEFFMNFPDRWYENADGRPTWADISGHISHSYLKSEELGDVCLKCMKPLFLVPPELTEERLQQILQSQETPA